MILTNLFEIKADFSFFVLYFYRFHFNKIFIIKKKSYTLHFQIKITF